jgi:hypothetical protein
LNEDLINQTKILRFGHFEKLIVGNKKKTKFFFVLNFDII